MSTCAHCACILRSGNDGPLCSPCEKTERDTALERLRAEAERPEHKVARQRIAVGPAQHSRVDERRDAILAMLAEVAPLDTGEIAMACGVTKECARMDMLALRDEGLVEDGRDGRHGLTWTWSLATDYGALLQETGVNVLSPFPAIGWNPAGTASKDPRVPVKCGWCLGAGRYLERMELWHAATHVQVRCENCRGRGTVLIERRRAR